MFVKISILLLVSIVLATKITDVENEWKNFKVTHQKSYATPEEEGRRFEIFKENLRSINEHNEKFAKGEVSYTQGINQFADLSEDEFKKSHLGLLH